MPNAAAARDSEHDAVDQAALRMMLSYVEAECLRIGAMDAARHAAMAAALMPVALRPTSTAALRQGRAATRARGVRTH
jgi:hypothetical protein